MSIQNSAIGCHHHHHRDHHHHHHLLSHRVIAAAVLFEQEGNRKRLFRIQNIHFTIRRVFAIFGIMRARYMHIHREKKIVLVKRQLIHSLTLLSHTHTPTNGRKWKSHKRSVPWLLLYYNHKAKACFEACNARAIVVPYSSSSSSALINVQVQQHAFAQFWNWCVLWNNSIFRSS